MVGDSRGRSENRSDDEGDGYTSMGFHLCIW